MTKARLRPVCAEPLPPSRTKPRIYCSHTCRQYAWDIERRAKSLAERAAAAMAAWERVKQAKNRV